MGAYSRASAQWVEGHYLTLRPSFNQTGAIFSYMTHVFWDDAKGHLSFSESDRSDNWFEQHGDVSISTLSGHIYLVTNSQGQYRALTLARAAKHDGLMGILSTLAMTHGSHGVPTACPIVLMRTDQATPHLGICAPEDTCFGRYRDLLSYAVNENFVQLLR